MSLRGAGLSAAFLLLATSSVLAVIRHVPGSYSTIQGGVTAAQIHDTVLVAEGTYYEQIDFLGKEITVASNYLIDGDPSHIEQTEIVAAHAGRPETLSAVLFISGESASTRLAGFRVIGGSGTYVPPHEGSEITCGGAVFCSDGSPIISDCILAGEVCAVYPGGSPSLENCTMSDVISYDWQANLSLAACSAGSVYAAYGGAVDAHHSTVSGPIEIEYGGSFSATSSRLAGDITVRRAAAGIDSSEMEGATLQFDGGIWISNSVVHKPCGMWGWMGELEFTGCTILGMLSQGSDQGQLSIRNSILNPSSDTAITSSGGYLQASCLVIDTSVHFPIVNMTFADTSHVFYASPRFCDPAGGEYSIRDNSLCAPVNNSCTQLIGARGVGCLCCVGVRGNANGLEGVDLSDLSTLVLYMVSIRGTVTGNWCPSEANADGKGIIDLSDLSFLIGYLTNPPGSVSLLPCPYSPLVSFGIRP